MTSLFLALSLPTFTIVGLWMTFNTEKVDAWILSDLQPNYNINLKLAVRGHLLSKVEV